MYICNIIFHLDGFIEDSWCVDGVDGKFESCQEPSFLQINPSYGVLPSIPENAAGENAEENPKEAAKGTTTNTAVYVNDLKQGTTAVYANDLKAVVEEYEYIDVSPTSTEQSQISKQQSPTYNNLEFSADYEIQYI